MAKFRLSLKKKDSLLAKGKSPDDKAAISTSYTTVVMGFILFFVYGFVLLLSSYTGGSIISVVGIQALQNNGTLAVVPQAAGLVAGVIFLKFLTKNFSLRSIMITGWTIATLFLFLEAVIDKIPGTLHSPLGTGLFFFFAFMFGLGVSGVSPGLGIFFSRRFTGKNRIVIFGSCQGLFGIGAGIMPLALAAILYQKNVSQTSIDSVRFFLYIAVALSFVCMFFSSLMNVPTASDDELKLKLTKTEKLEQKKKNLTIFNFRIILMCAILFYIFYMFCETVGSYNIQRFISDNWTKNNYPNSSQANLDYNNLMITAIRCAGLLSFTEGLTRTFASIFICPRVKFRHFLTASLIILIGAYAFTLSGVATKNLQNNKAVAAYILAIWFGIGIGNIWPTLNSFLNEIDNKRAALISIHINRTTSIMILIAQSIASAMLNYSGLHRNNANNHHKLTIILSIAIGSAISLIIGLFVLTWWLKSKKITNPDEYKAVFYRKAIKPSWVTT